MSKKEIIDYPAAELWNFRVFLYEWIDNLNFTLPPEACLDHPETYLNIARAQFKKAGWAGDGAIELMWIPPFMFSGRRTPEFTKGVTVWHVKQKEDGISWILSPIELPGENEFK
jgi:hypothetical protein